MRARRGEQQSEVGSGAARHRKTNRERKQDRDEEDRRAAAHIPYTYGQTGPSSPAYPVGVKPALTLVLGGLIAACALGVGAFLALRGGEPAPRAERPARTAPEPAARPTRNLAVRDAEGVERRISIAIGAPDTPTPLGELYIPDTLPGTRFAPSPTCTP